MFLVDVSKNKQSGCPLRSGTSALPRSGLCWQPKMSVISWHVLQDLLEFVSHYHCLLDLINLVTCLYRLAKMSKEASRARSSYLSELQKHPTFQLLLREWRMCQH
jgi:hypothetical protein